MFNWFELSFIASGGCFRNKLPVDECAILFFMYNSNPELFSRKNVTILTIERFREYKSNEHSSQSNSGREEKC